MKIISFLLALFNGVICSGVAVAYTLDEINNITNGIGLVKIKVINHSESTLVTNVMIDLINPPIGFEHNNFLFRSTVEVGALRSKVVFLPKPVIGDYASYKNGEERPILPESCRVMVSEGYGELSDRAKYYWAHYIENTKLITVPSTTIHIGTSSSNVQELKNRWEPQQLSAFGATSIW